MLPTDSSVKLHVLVSDGGRELCRVAMPTASVDNLSHFFPDEDRVAVESAGVDFSAISSRVRASGYAPQTVLETKTASRSYRLWIE